MNSFFRNFFMVVLTGAAFLNVTSCNDAANNTTKAATTEAAKMATPPDMEIAPQEYVTLAEASIQKGADNDIDGRGAMLSDDVEFYYPDGDQNTRTKFIGKTAVINWLKSSRINGGQKSTTVSAINSFPLKVNKKMNAGALSGYQVLSYFTNSSTYNNGNSVSVRMNVVQHFNDSKLIDRIITFYDRTPFIKAAGKNILDAAKK